ncbi:hypothetical protein ACJIZ3_013256 [Penstemon smallii]|uniref:Protein CHUP1, chloroplastic n=1 Tax=Penstemon smallii TaxID=265156 RepID=A0ABD3UPB6_9LAMI
MVAGTVKTAMGLRKTPSPIPPPVSKPQKGSGAAFSRSLGAYFPRASAQVQPRPPDISELLRLVEELRESESRLKTELLEQKLLRESVAIVPLLENVISNKDSEIERSRKKIECLETENERLREENECLLMELSRQNHKYEEKIIQMQAELADIKTSFAEQQEDASSISSSSSTTLKFIDVANNTSNYKSKSPRKCMAQSNVVETGIRSELVKNETICNSEEIPERLIGIRSPAPRVPRPPPRPSDSTLRTLPEISKIPPPPPPPPLREKPAAPPRSKTAAPPPPPPPPPSKGLKAVRAKVKRVPEVVEFYHSLMRRDMNYRRDSGGGSGGAADAQAAGATAKDMIGEIENRSAHLIAIKTDVETQGDFIRFLIKEVEGAAFTDIEDVVPFVKWLDDELSYLVDERAVLKHFDWPEQKADALREAAFGYCDLKKLEFEASSYRDDPRQPCGSALKKMQSLFEKLEHGVYNLSRMRESASNRYKVFKIPMNWMMDTGYVSQIKLASVKLAIKYMKRVLAELDMVGGGPEEEELIVQGVKFAFRVHQFAGGFDVETMRTFQELRDKAQLCNVQCQNQHQQKLVCRS